MHTHLMNFRFHSGWIKFNFAHNKFLIDFKLLLKLLLLRHIMKFQELSMKLVIQNQFILTNVNNYFSKTFRNRKPFIGKLHFQKKLHHYIEPIKLKSYFLRFQSYYARNEYFFLHKFFFFFF